MLLLLLLPLLLLLLLCMRGEGRPLVIVVVKTGVCARVEFANFVGKGETHAQAGGWVPLNKHIKNFKMCKNCTC